MSRPEHKQLKFESVMQVTYYLQVALLKYCIYPGGQHRA